MLWLLLPLVCCGNQDGLLGAHNRERGKYKVGLLQWDSALANKASEHAKHCSYQHSSTSFRTYDSKGCSNCHHGENLAMRGDCPPDMNDWVNMWLREVRYYDCERGVKSPWGETGHWTQAVWSGTSYLGCAMNCKCAGKYEGYLVCHYSRAGNMNGVRPFPKENCKYSDVPPPHTWMSSGQKAITISSLVISVTLILSLSFVFFILNRLKIECSFDYLHLSVCWQEEQLLARAEFGVHVVCGKSLISARSRKLKKCQMVSSAFEKIRAQQSLDQKIAVPDVEETEDVPVEIFTKKGRRCGVCPTHLDPFELTVLCY